VGNDFIPNIPSIDIKNGGMDLLIKIYATVHMGMGQCFYENGKVNNEFLCNFIGEIAKYEKYYFENKYVNYKRRMDDMFCPSNDPYEVDIWNFENMKVKLDEDPIKLGQCQQEVWHNKYYDHYYKVGRPDDRDILIGKMCHNFIEGVNWITHYYFNKCISNVWQYNYYHGPFASDIHKYLKMNKGVNIVFNNNITIYPFVQLLAVISPTCKQLLPKSYQKKMECDSDIIDLFPQHVLIDTLYKHVQHKCIPMIPNIDIGRIIKSCDGCTVNDVEQERNKLLSDFVFINK
jgi:5'-3' exonuclease